MTPVVERLIAQYFSVVAGELCLDDGVRVSAVAQAHGTPQFVYVRRVAEQKLALLRQALPPRFNIYYSVKANPNRAILRCFLAQGCGLEIASAGEYRIARDAGCPPHQIVFAGPGKTEAELRLVLSEGIGEIHVESLREAGRLDRLAGELGVRITVALRINPGAEAEGGAMRMGGRAVPFGIDEEQVDVVLNEVRQLPRLDLVGIHMFAGTQILDHAVLIRQYRTGLAIARHVSDRLGYPVQMIDFGGGLGIPYFSGENELDMKALGDALATLVEEVGASPALAGARFMVEPGRFLIGEAGIYLARVNDIKISRGRRFLILDGGMNHHLAASGNLGQVLKRNFPIAIVNKLDQPPAEKVDVVGPLCTPLDTLARDVELPAADIGDIVGIFQSGAYARSASPLGFLSHPVPPEVWVDYGRVELATPRGRLDI